MGNYTCEDESLCKKFQSAICLHCSRRLCLEHINEHNQIVPGSINNLANELECTFYEINNTYEKSQETCNELISSLNQWRMKQTTKIQQIYETNMNSIEAQQRNLSLLHKELAEELEQNVRQELKLVESQKDYLSEKLKNARQTIKKVRQNSSKLKCDLSSLPHHIKLELLEGDSVQIRSPTSIPKSNLKSLSWIKRCTTCSSPHDLINLKQFRPFKRLVDMFSNVSYVEQSRASITNYLKLQGVNFQLPILVCSYITAWHRKIDMHEKHLVLNEYISTLSTSITNRHSGYIFLLGIYGFFYNETILEKKRDIMAYLLNYFTSQKCVMRDQILIWYNHKQLQHCLDFDGAKLLMTPYIESFRSKHPNHCC